MTDQPDTAPERPQRRGRTRIPVVACVVAALLLVAGFVALRVQQPYGGPLLRKARAVHVPRFRGEYAWRSDVEVLVFPAGPGGLSGAAAQRIDGGAPSQLGAFNAVYRPDTYPSYACPLLSPDRRRALWTAKGPGGPLWASARLNGAGLVTWPRTENPGSLYSPTAWARDGRHWLEWQGGPNGATLLWHDADRPGQTRSIAVPLDLAHSLVGDLGGGRVLLLRCRNPFDVQEGQPALVRIDDTHPRGTATRPQLPPDTTGIEEIALSPAGDRLAWMLRLNGDPSTGALHSALGRVARRQSTYGLCVSAVDGTRMREVGRFNGPYMPPNEHMVWGLKWQPSGRRISFFWDRYLRIVPVD